MNKNDIDHIISKSPYFYKQALDFVETLIGHKKTTTNHELDAVGKKLFQHKWNGVYAQDVGVKMLDKDKPYMIMNVDESNQKGSHWVSVIYNASTDTFLVYDSFGRPSKKLLKILNAKIGGKIKDSEYDSEQKIKQSNCGQRSLASIIIYDMLGEGAFLKL